MKTAKPHRNEQNADRIDVYQTPKPQLQIRDGSLEITWGGGGGGGGGKKILMQDFKSYLSAGIFFLLCTNISFKPQPLAGIFFSQVSLAGIFFRTNHPPPAISNGPSLRATT